MRFLYSLCCSAIAGLLLSASPNAVRAQSECPRGALPAYAHNDYENARPLTDALALGFRGVEADVFLVDGTLRVGHDRKAASAGATLDSLYLAPLKQLVAQCGRLTSDDRPFFLAIEIKETDVAAYDSLVALLGRYRELAALNVVLVGWHPAAAPVASAPNVSIGWQHRIVSTQTGQFASLDARIRLLSLDYGKTMGRWWVTAAGRRRWLAALRAAKAAASGRLLRVHNVPTDDKIYAELLAAGVDLIGTKQLLRTSQLLSANRSGSFNR